MQGEFKSIMAIVTPCRSDMSAGGLARTVHLSDGRLKLVLVKRCSVLQYLRLLARIPVLGAHWCFLRVDVLPPHEMNVTKP